MNDVIVVVDFWAVSRPFMFKLNASDWLDNILRLFDNSHESIKSIQAYGWSGEYWSYSYRNSP